MRDFKSRENLQKVKEAPWIQKATEGSILCVWRGRGWDDFCDNTAMGWFQKWFFYEQGCMTDFCENIYKYVSIKKEKVKTEFIK